MSHHASEILAIGAQLKELGDKCRELRKARQERMLEMQKQMNADNCTEIVFNNKKFRLADEMRGERLTNDDKLNKIVDLLRQETGHTYAVDDVRKRLAGEKRRVQRLKIN